MSIPHWSEDKRKRFRKKLLSWFSREKRSLPWRTQNSLYRTVVSEFMLQQTRVDTVIRYFNQWLVLFPDFHTLSLASEEQVLKAWEGLGYYRRAKSLHALAKQIAPLKDIPTDEAFWLSLPGVGPYTAAAIRSLAFAEPSACVDGNIVRILARLQGDQTRYRDSSTAARLLAPEAESLLDRESPGAFNEAMMELGATVCLPRKPLCLTCPVKEFCAGYGMADIADIPRFQKIKMIEKQVQRLFLYSPDHGVLLHKNIKNSKRLHSFFEIPVLPESLKHHQDLKQRFTGRRGISNERWVEEIYSLPISENILAELEPLPDHHWLTLEELSHALLSGPHRKWLNKLLTE